ncbi:substrate-binding domain-containing protein [Thalassolituus alkanivorans]|uniref:substrate-binding domain-containing protein n=1 Tax=Thalassolituus alkanivorans TaxID=2881055 RepID=UPI001E2A4CE8|nr:phosphate ABC transporter substrate-binding/OmpA family protein [Thalassolituus alkanivorans]MCB2385836.1 phosphate ABC transporter substrate-binding/OmpA family protein [Thalassolituus alkanivorans]MCB2421686.1 phosphate ABC transporter substrate-binding/OmpA family protein [Thalassolituus alkanivorans]
MNFWRNFFSSVLTFIFAVTVHAGQIARFDGLPVDGEINLFSVQGSNTIGAELAPNLVKAWLQEKGAEKIEVQNSGIDNEVEVSGFYPATRTRVMVKIAAHGSGTGFKGLAAGSADIAAASRPIKDKEFNLLKPLANMRSPGSEHIIGIDGLAIIVHPDNPVSDLSVEEIAEIFSGGYSDWSEVGGKPGPIHVYARDDKSGTWDSFSGMVLGERNLIAGAERFESNAELSDRVAADTAGIGFVGLSSVRSARLLSVSDGSAKSLLPNKLTVATEDYALARRLFMYTDDEPANDYVKEFIDFSLQDAGQKIVADTGFISQELKAVIPEFYDELPEDFRQLTSDAKRLTINFRFQEGSAKLDNKALKDLERLADFLHANGSAEVVLIGFGDKKKTEKRSQLLSKLRAMAVRRELVRYGIYPKNSVGYGENLPVASVNGMEGRNKNRRVEVWVRKAGA